VLALVLCAIAPSVSATDYSMVERISEDMLTDREKNLSIIGPEVKINSSQVTINYVSISTNLNNLLTDIGAIIGVYWGIVDNYPEVGDLFVTIEDSREKPMATFYCLKSWVTGASSDSNSQLERLVLRVINTVETVPS